jgi:hypothetical protein
VLDLFVLRTRLLTPRRSGPRTRSSEFFPAVTNGVLTGRGIASTDGDAHHPAALRAGETPAPCAATAGSSSAPLEDLLFGFELLVVQPSHGGLVGRRLRELRWGKARDP